MKKEDILLIIEKYILPLFFISQAIKVLITFPSEGLNLSHLSSILKPIIIAFLMFTATNRQRSVNLKTTLGLLLSFGSIYFVSIEDRTFSKTSLIFLSSSLIFYIVLSFIALFNLGRSFSILPSSNNVKTSGLYSLVRHPIYASYIHIFIIFVTIHFNFLNLVLLTFFCIGLLIRATEEEKLLKSSSELYAEKMFQIPRFFTIVLTLPILLTIASVGFDQYKGTQKKASLNISGPVYSLIPTNADDWSSFFVMNHIYPRFIRRSGEFRSNSAITEKNLYCEDKENSLLSSSCKRVVLEFKFKEGFIGCNQKNYTQKHFRKELESILLSKNWILPNFRWCKDSPTCISFDNVPNIQNHLESIYLKFGWSLFEEDDLLVGIAPNCFSIKSKDEGRITEGTLFTKNWILDISTSDTNPDIFLFENSFSTKTHNNIKFFNPIYYFFLANGDENKVPTWISKKLMNTITEEFSRSGIFQIIKKNEYLLSEFQQYQFDLTNYTSSKTPKVIALPDYLEDCSKIAFQIKEKIKTSDPNITLKCVNISEYIEFGVKQGKTWDAFIGPLTPGLPGKNALATQYFNASSSDRWLGRKYPSQTRVALLGISHGSMLLKKNTFCSIMPNSLGLSDLTIDDFQSCSY